MLIKTQQISNIYRVMYNTYTHKYVCIVYTDLVLTAVCTVSTRMLNFAKAFCSQHPVFET